MTESPSPTIVAAHGVLFATYSAPIISGLPLEGWQKAGSSDEIRRVDIVHDVATALLQIDVHRELTLPEIAALAERLRNRNNLPTEHRLGTSFVLAVKTTDLNAGAAVVAAGLGKNAGHIVGGPWRDVGALFAGNDPSFLAILCEPGDDADQRMSLQLYETIRVLETYRHKIDGQFAKYESDYRSQLLDSIEALESQLRLVARQASSPIVAGADPLAALSQGVTAAYCSASLVHAPIREIQAMLTANLRNLQAVLEQRIDVDAMNDPGVRLLRRRVDLARMCQAQVEADLGRAEPVFDAARWVGQFHHGQLLAQMTAAEAEENRQRDRESSQRDQQTFRLTLLAAWLGGSQVWAAWIALWPSDGRPENLLTLLILCFLPTVLGASIYFAHRVQKSLATRNDTK